MISNTLATGVQGILDGKMGMQDAASRIARTGTEAPAADTGAQPESTASLAENMVDLRVNQRSAEASVAVVRTADEMLGSLIDERA